MKVVVDNLESVEPQAEIAEFPSQGYAGSGYRPWKGRR
jgi:hypothetical protein